jgi:hypothetical protein
VKRNVQQSGHAKQRGNRTEQHTAGRKEKGIVDREDNRERRAEIKTAENEGKRTDSRDTGADESRTKKRGSRIRREQGAENRTGEQTSKEA